MYLYPTHYGNENSIVDIAMLKIQLKHYHYDVQLQIYTYGLE